MCNVYRYSIVLLAAVLMASCGGKKPQSAGQRPAFSSDSAYAYIEKQMSFGPRVPNSAAHMQCAVWLIEQLRECGAEVELQKGQMPDYKGDNQQIYNIIGHFYTPQNATRARILLGAHYDTRPWCDEEEDYSDRFYNVPGANDGASGVGVLLEVARQIGLRMADSTQGGPATPVDIVFFDCEDMGTPHFYTGTEREDTWCLGSQLWATNYARHAGEAGLYLRYSPRYGGCAGCGVPVRDVFDAVRAELPAADMAFGAAVGLRRALYRAAVIPNNRRPLLHQLHSRHPVRGYHPLRHPQCHGLRPLVAHAAG